MLAVTRSLARRCLAGHQVAIAGSRRNFVCVIGVGQHVGIFERRRGVSRGLGDDDYVALYFGHIQRVVRLATLLGALDPEDVGQTAFCKLYEVRHRVTAEGDVVRYLNRIVVNEVRSRHRRHRVASQGLEVLANDVRLTEQHGDIALRQTLLQHMSVLTVAQREVLVLRYWGELPLAQIAEVTGTALNTVKSHLHRGLAKLNELMEDRDVQD
jgi:RNA polymerase sigma factor (sigma-70 family)